MAKKYTIRFEVEAEVTAASEDVAVNYADLLVSEAIRKVTGVSACKIVGVVNDKSK